MIPVQGQLTDLGGLGSQAESSYKVALPPDAPTSLDLVSSPGQKSIWPGLSRESVSAVVQVFSHEHELHVADLSVGLCLCSF